MSIFNCQEQEFEDKDTALLIDRYKYMDLFPCSHMELKVLGYFVSILELKVYSLYFVFYSRFS